MALNVILSDVRSERRARPVGNNVAPGTPLISGSRPAITITGSRDYAGNAINVTGNGQTLLLAGGKGGQSLPADDYATVTFTGSYALPVEGATITTAVNGVSVYIDADGDLTLTETDNTFYGEVEFFRGTDSATDTVVTIGK